MRTINNSDQKIQDAFRLQEEGLTVSDAVKKRIDEQIQEEEFARNASNVRRIKGGSNMKISMKRVGIGIATACLMVSGFAFAGEIKGWRSHSSLNDPVYKSYAQITEAEKTFGHAVDSVEQFDNGYRFTEATISPMEAFDEAGHTIMTVDQLWIDYTKEGSKGLSLVLEESREGVNGISDKTPDATKEIDGVTVRFDSYTYKFVPVGYELTPEDKANMQRDDYEISEGSDSVKIAQNDSVRWVKNGVCYDLFGFDTTLDSEAFFKMAEEIITSK